MGYWDSVCKDHSLFDCWRMFSTGHWTFNRKVYKRGK